MSLKESLTGKRRYDLRKPWLRQAVLVLQVEVRQSGYSVEYIGGHDVDFTYWRDATIADLTVSHTPPH